MAVKPLGGRVLVKPLEEKERTEGGIVLPESVSEKPTEGKVVAVGPGELLENGKRAEMPVKEGDTVVFGKYAGMDLKVNGQEHKILQVTDLLAVRED